MSDPPTRTRLPDRALLDAWEEGAGGLPVERALAVLAQARPDEEAGTLERWPVGRRDAELLAVHAGTFGERLDAVVDCPECDEPLELGLRAGDLRAPHAEPGEEHELADAPGGHRLRFRAPASADLVSAARCPDAAAGHAHLIERSLLEIERDGQPVSIGELPSDLLSALDARLSEVDAQADLRLALTCPECEHEWSGVLDIGDYVWREVEASARRLFAEVARLAAGYGWDEEAILALSESRRRVYLDLLGG